MTELFGTPEYWQAVAAGRITWDQAERDQRTTESRRARAIASQSNRTRDPRGERQPPDASRQWVREMATTAYRDDRLTMGAKALLAIIVAETGEHEGRGRMLNKSYLARRIKRSTRTVQRYLAQLRRYGYIAAEAVATRAGWCVGQILRALPVARPFWHWQNARGRKIQGETQLTPTKALGLKTNGFTQDRRQQPTLPLHRNNGVRLVGAQIGGLISESG